MPVPILNLIPTQDTYTDALTVVFSAPRQQFTLQVVRATVYYKILLSDPRLRQEAYRDFAMERVNGPVISNFNDPANEGAPPGWQYAGIMLRSYTPGAPALVSVF